MIHVTQLSTSGLTSFNGEIKGSPNSQYTIFKFPWEPRVAELPMGWDVQSVSQTEDTACINHSHPDLLNNGLHRKGSWCFQSVCMKEDSVERLAVFRDTVHWLINVGLPWNQWGTQGKSNNRVSRSTFLRCVLLS